MNIIIEPSSRQGKKYGAIIDNKKQFHLVRKVHQILQSTKIAQERIDIYKDIRKLSNGTFH